MSYDETAEVKRDDDGDAKQIRGRGLSKVLFPQCLGATCAISSLLNQSPRFVSLNNQLGAAMSVIAHIIQSTFLCVVCFVPWFRDDGDKA